MSQKGILSIICFVALTFYYRSYAYSPRECFSTLSMPDVTLSAGESLKDSLTLSSEQLEYYNTPGHEPKPLAWELNLSYKSNSCIAIYLSDNQILNIHLSDRHTGSDISTPYFRVEYIVNDSKQWQKDFSITNHSKHFAAIKIEPSRIYISTDRFNESVVAEGIIIPTDPIIKCISGQVTVLRTIFSLPPQLSPISQSYLSNPDNNTVWVLRDEDIDTDYAIVGGDYTVATVSTEDILEIIYLSGAKINSDLWQRGMIKATGTKIEDGTYLLTWTDADFDTSARRVYAVFTNNSMTITFPYDGNSILRFVKKESLIDMQHQR